MRLVCQRCGLAFSDYRVIAFVPLTALGAGLAIGLLRRFDPRPLLVLRLGVLLTRTTDFIPFIVPGSSPPFLERRR